MGNLWLPAGLSYAELDADIWGMFISMVSGYDPYAAAGTLAKYAMAADDASLIAQNFDGISGDPHGSFNNRIAVVYASLKALCQQVAAKPFCSAYKNAVHPDFPASAPLIRKPGGILTDALVK